MPPRSNSRSLKPDTLLYVVAFFSWIAIWRVQDLIPGIDKLPMGIIAEVLTLAFFISDSRKERRVQWIRSPILAIVCILFGLMVAGLPMSLWPGKGVNFIARDFTPTIILMIIMATSVRERDDLEWLAFANFVGGVIFALYVYRFCPVGGDGKLANLPYYDANDFALLINCTIPFAIYFLRPGVTPWKRLFATGAVALFAMMIVRSGSRGGFIGLVTVALYILVRYRAVPARLRIGALTAGAAVFALVGSASYWQSISTLMNPEKDYNMTEETGRRAVWQRGLLYMRMRPVLGVGVRAFPQAEGTLSPTARQWAEMGRGIKWSVAHNSFVEIGAECGVAALFLFVGMIVLTLATLRRVRAGPRGSPLVTSADEAFAQMLFASLVVFCVCGFFVSAEYFAYLYVLLALSIGQQAIFRRRAARPPAPAVQPPGAAAAPAPKARPRRSTWVPAAS